MNFLTAVPFDQMTRTKHSEEMMIPLVKLHKTRGDFQKNAKADYTIVYRHYPHLLNMLTMMKRKWVEEDVVSGLSKYQYRDEIRLNNPALYSYLHKQCRQLLETLPKRKIKWTEDAVKNEALKYSWRTEFSKGCESAYQAATKNFPYLLDELFPEIDVRGSDNDCIYIWRVVGQFHHGVPIYKIGVTSSRLGHGRIIEVAKKAKMSFDIVCCEKTICKATDIERKLHCLGVSPRFEKIDGKTEFRALTDSALYTAISIICSSL